MHRGCRDGGCLVLGGVMSRDVEGKMVPVVVVVVVGAASLVIMSCRYAFIHFNILISYPIYFSYLMIVLMMVLVSL